MRYWLSLLFIGLLTVAFVTPALACGGGGMKGDKDSHSDSSVATS